MLMRSSEFGTMTSSRNILLQTLDRSDRELLEPHFEEIELKRGEVLIQPDEALDFVYFPNSGIFSVEECIGRRRHIEIAVVGHEGLLGWPALLGCARSCHSAVVQGHDGSALRIGVRSFLDACRESGTLRMVLLSFVQTIILQMARAIASHLDHSLDQNLARWLLMRHDRVDGDELHVRHEEIADAIGVRRASITDTMHVLEGDHLVRCNRGRLVIRDRRELERVAGEAYGHAERQYRTMIAPFGKLPADFSLS
jgi:CRP-like cAMP-binding protein